MIGVDVNDEETEEGTIPDNCSSHSAGCGKLCAGNRVFEGGFIFSTISGDWLRYFAEGSAWHS